MMMVMGSYAFLPHPLQARPLCVILWHYAFRLLCLAGTPSLEADSAVSIAQANLLCRMQRI